jgi:phosphatidylserine synthase
MFFVRFIVGGLFIASLPLIADKFGNKIAGYITLFPIIMFISFMVLYLSEGEKATEQASKAYLVGLPAVAVASLAILILVQKGFNVYIAVAVGIIGWIFVIFITAKYIY